MANSSKKQDWIQDAVKRKGAFTKSDKWSKSDAKVSSRTKKQANLAKTLRGFKKS